MNDGEDGGVVSLSPSMKGTARSTDDEDGLTGEWDPARREGTIGLVLMFVLTAFLPVVGEDVSLPPVPIRGPGGVRRPDGDIGLVFILERLDVELEGVESMEAWPSGDVGRECWDVPTG